MSLFILIVSLLQCGLKSQGELNSYQIRELRLGPLLNFCQCYMLRKVLGRSLLVNKTSLNYAFLVPYSCTKNQVGH